MRGPEVCVIGVLFDNLIGSLVGLKMSWSGARVEAYPVDSGASICGRLGGKAFALGFLGFSRLMMSQYVVGTWLEARPSRVSNDAWR